MTNISTTHAVTRRLICLWEEVVQDQTLLQQIIALHEDFRLIDRSTFYWYARSLNGPAKPQNPLEELAEIVIATVQPEALAGVEYWTNTLETGESMHMHQDKDEKLYWSRKEFAHPLYSTVFYPGQVPFEGGEIAVAANRVQPGPNQLIAFRGSLPHGVGKVRSGARHSIALNLWDRTPSAYKTFEV